ncbi:MAG: hypothetical protein HNEKOMLI_00299 [Sodalis sp. Psp]|nr:hypothetical protein [Sodalis sp. Psp]MCR3756794.1 hypothetical protein [Sodalis sp. Ppy]
MKSTNESRTIIILEMLKLLNLIQIQDSEKIVSNVALPIHCAYTHLYCLGLLNDCFLKQMIVCSISFNASSFFRGDIIHKNIFRL